jgi:CheY-like chemotaxis protein
MLSNVPPKTVLIIDNHVDFADSLAVLLRHYGHKPLVSYDPDTGLAIAEKQRPDIIALNIEHTGRSGYDIARELRQDPAFDNTVLVAITGHASDAHRERAHAAGFDVHCPKPIDIPDLYDILIARRRTEPFTAPD